jgi:DNA-binding PadR family transcriptional regulator
MKSKKGPLDNYNRRMIIRAIWNAKDISAYKTKKLIGSKLSLSTIVGHLDVLAEHGLVTKIRNDRGTLRRHLYTLTDEGKEQFIEDFKQEMRGILDSPMESDFRKIILEIYGEQPEKCFNL